MALFAGRDQQPSIIPYRFESCVVGMMQVLLRGISRLALQNCQWNIEGSMFACGRGCEYPRHRTLMSMQQMAV